MTEEPHPYERLTPDLVMDCVESVGFQCDARNIALNSYENRVYQIGLEDDEPLIGKFYRPGRWSDEQILEEHRFTRELEEQEIPVVPPLKLPNDNTLAQVAYMVAQVAYMVAQVAYMVAQVVWMIRDGPMPPTPTDGPCRRPQSPGRCSGH